MIVSNCCACYKTIYVAEDDEEQRHNPKVTKYWSYENDKSKRPYCDGACALVDHLNKNNEEVPDWLTNDQKIITK